MPPKLNTIAGTIYLIHLDPAYKHAKHYLGWTQYDPVDRLSVHAAGHGSRLLAVAMAAGCSWRLVRLWPDRTRADERAMKLRRMAPRWCPVCSAARSSRSHGGPTRLRPATIAEYDALRQRYPLYAGTGVNLPVDCPGGCPGNETGTGHVNGCKHAGEAAR